MFGALRRDNDRCRGIVSSAAICSIALQVILLRRRSSWLKFGFEYSSVLEVRRLVAPALAVMALPLAQATFLQGTALVIGWTMGASRLQFIRQ